jgi:hypothetical protein
MRCLVDLDRRIGLKQRNLLLAFLTSTSLSLSALATALADASIVVDASTPLAQSASGNDLATLQNIFQGANIPAEPAMEPALTLLKPIMVDLKIKRLRFLQSDNLCDLDASGDLGSVSITGTNPNGGYTFGPVMPGGCNLLDRSFPWALNNGLSPHVAVASFMPASFVSSGAAETWSPTTLNRYKTYADRLVRYIVTKAFDAGAPSLVFEVSNELDIADSQPQVWDSSNPSTAKLALLGPWGRWLWWIDPNSYNLHGWPGPGSYPFQFDTRRLEHGISPVQKIYADVIDSVRNDPNIQSRYPGKTIEICGPAFSTASFDYYPLQEQPTLEESFLDQMLNPSTLGGQFNSPLDRFSFHYYGDFKNGFGWDPGAGPKTTLAYVTGTIRSKLNSLGRGNIPPFLSEWGPVTTASEINYSHAGAAWAAAFLTEAVADGISMGSYLTLSDAIGSAPTGDRYVQSLTHKVTNSDGSAHYYPKPVANVFKMFAMMTGTRRQVALSPAGGSNSNLGAFVTSDRDAKSADVLVFNYDSQMFSRPPVDTPENVLVELDNLPFDDGPVSVRRYLVDANTSNLKAFLDNSNHPDPSLQMVEQFTAQVQDGRLVLPSVSLGLGVTLWKVSG